MRRPRSSPGTPVLQKELWRVQEPRMVTAAVLATGGDLVFQGAIDGTFNAYSAREGQRVWTFDARAPAIAPPMSFSVSGRQYVTVLTGMGTAPSLWGSMILRYRWDYRTLARRVLTFSLGGQSTLPLRRYPTWTKPPDPTFKQDDALA
jgi:quinohemoprotein ethanol dehydrogenase